MTSYYKHQQNAEKSQLSFEKLFEEPVRNEENIVKAQGDIKNEN